MVCTKHVVLHGFGCPCLGVIIIPSQRFASHLSSTHATIIQFTTHSSDEQRFLEASLAYAAGKPILSDEQFDLLKAKLKQSGSTITAQGPRCSIRSRKMYSDLDVDYLKMTALNIPASLVVCFLWVWV